MLQSGGVEEFVATLGLGLYSLCVEGDVNLLGAGNPLGIDLCGSFCVVARERM